MNSVNVLRFYSRSNTRNITPLFMQNPLVKTYGDKKTWVNWRYETRDGNKTKVPVQPNGQFAKSSDPATWNVFNDLDPNKGVGIIFGPDKTVLGLDLDHVLTDGVVDDCMKDVVEQLVEKANTYVEVSPSGEGLHLYFDLERPTSPTQNKYTFEKEGKTYGYELYTHGRFFTVTRKPYGDTRSVRTVSLQELRGILSIIGYPWERAHKDGKATSNTNSASAINSAPVPADVTDDMILERMMNAKNGTVIRSIWDGDISTHNNDYSSADASLCSHLAFWCDNDPSRIERLWMQSPLGMRGKTKRRKDYRQRTIAHVIANTSETYGWGKKMEQIKTKADADGKPIEYLCTKDAKGNENIVCNTENVTRLLRQHPFFKDRVRYDEFSSAMEIYTNNEWNQYHDGDEISWQRYASIIEPAFIRVSKSVMFDAMLSVAMDMKVHVAHDWMKSLVWDGKARLDTWLVEAFGVPDNEYYRCVGRNWIMAIAKRTHTPGSKFDHVLILEGAQGTKKSTALYTLGNVMPGRIWHMETTLDTSNKDFFVTLQGKLIVEFSEGETLSRSEVKQLKAIITTQVDTFRAPYGRSSQEYPRRGVFAMTTNMEEYLKDETGNRRYLPVKVEKEIDIDWLTDNRDQLYAEAYERVVRKNEKYWEFPLEEMERMQDERRVSSANEESVVEWFSTVGEDVRQRGITTKEVWQGAYHGGVAMGASMRKYEEMEIADILKRVIKLERRRVMIDNIRRWKWFERDDVESPVQFTADEWGEIIEKEE